MNLCNGFSASRNARQDVNPVYDGKSKDWNMGRTENVLPSKNHLSMSLRLSCRVGFVSHTCGTKKVCDFLFLRSCLDEGGVTELGFGSTDFALLQH